MSWLVKYHDKYYRLNKDFKFEPCPGRGKKSLKVSKKIPFFDYELFKINGKIFVSYKGDEDLSRAIYLPKELFKKISGVSANDLDSLFNKGATDFDCHEVKYRSYSFYYKGEEVADKESFDNHVPAWIPFDQNRDPSKTDKEILMKDRLYYKSNFVTYSKLLYGLKIHSFNAFNVFFFLEWYKVSSNTFGYLGNLNEFLPFYLTLEHDKPFKESLPRRSFAKDKEGDVIFVYKNRLHYKKSYDPCCKYTGGLLKEYSEADIVKAIEEIPYSGTPDFREWGVYLKKSVKIKQKTLAGCFKDKVGFLFNKEGTMLGLAKELWLGPEGYVEFEDFYSEALFYIIDSGKPWYFADKVGEIFSVVKGSQRGRVVLTKIEDWEFYKEFDGESFTWSLCSKSLGVSHLLFKNDGNDLVTSTTEESFEYFSKLSGKPITLPYILYHAKEL